MKWGPHLKSLRKIEEQTNVEPEAILTYPAVPEPYREYCDAFTLLSSRRTVGMGMNPISLQDIKAYMDMFGIPSFGARLFVDMIVIMDSKYLELTATKK